MAKETAFDKQQAIALVKSAVEALEQARGQLPDEQTWAPLRGDFNAALNVFDIAIQRLELGE